MSYTANKTKQEALVIHLIYECKTDPAYYELQETYLSKICLGNELNFDKFHFPLQILVFDDDDDYDDDYHYWCPFVLNPR